MFPGRCRSDAWHLNGWRSETCPWNRRFGLEGKEIGALLLRPGSPLTSPPKTSKIHETLPIRQPRFTTFFTQSRNQALTRCYSSGMRPCTLASTQCTCSDSASANSFFKTLVDHEVTVELKNDIQIRGTLKSVDQYLNIKLDDIQVVEELKYPHLVSTWDSA